MGAKIAHLQENGQWMFSLLREAWRHLPRWDVTLIPQRILPRQSEPRFPTSFYPRFPTAFSCWDGVSEGFVSVLPSLRGITPPPAPRLPLCPHPTPLLFGIQRAPNDATAPTGARQNPRRRSPLPLPHRIPPTTRILPPPASFTPPENSANNPRPAAPLRDPLRPNDSILISQLPAAALGTLLHPYSAKNPPYHLTLQIFGTRL